MKYRENLKGFGLNSLFNYHSCPIGKVVESKDFKVKDTDNLYIGDNSVLEILGLVLLAHLHWLVVIYVLKSIIKSRNN